MTGRRGFLGGWTVRGRHGTAGLNATNRMLILLATAWKGWTAFRLCILRTLSCGTDREHVDRAHSVHALCTTNAIGS